MKVIFLAPANSIHTVRWVNALKNKVEIVLISKSDHKATDYISNNVKIYYLKYKGPLGYYLNANELKKIIKMEKPDILNAHYASGYGTLARLARFHPILLSIWGSDVYEFPHKSRLNEYVLRKNLLCADEIASTSECMAQQVKKFFKENKKISITPFGVDCELFKKERIQHDTFNFGIIKTLTPKYGIEYLIKSYDCFLKKIPNESRNKTRLYIYGKGTEKSTYEQLCEELGIEYNVRFMGFIQNKEVPSALNQFDVFCLSSIENSESFGVAAVEAMACELPVIATDVDGFKEVIEDNVSGIIVTRKDIDSMAETMNYLYSNAHIRNELGENARKRVLQFYNWNNNVDHMLEIYNNIIKKI